MLRVKCFLTHKLKRPLACAIYLVLLFNQDICWSQDKTKSSPVTHIADTVIEIKGSMCPACLKKVEDHLAKLPGVVKIYTESKWDLRIPESNRNKLREGCALLHVSFRENETNLDDLFDIIKTDGFEAHVVVN